MNRRATTTFGVLVSAAALSVTVTLAAPAVTTRSAADGLRMVTRQDRAMSEPVTLVILGSVFAAAGGFARRKNRRRN